MSHLVADSNDTRPVTLPGLVFAVPIAEPVGCDVRGAQTRSTIAARSDQDELVLQAEGVEKNFVERSKSSKRKVQDL